MSGAYDLAILAAGQDGRIASLVAEAVDRAHAHANLALTKALVATHPGRASLRRTIRNLSYQSAIRDLDELLTRLAGPSVSSLDGALRDARVRIYRAAFAHHFAATPEAFRTPSPDPTAARLDEVRRLVLHGYELRREIAGPIETAKAGLAPALEAASRPGVLDKDAADKLQAWADRARNAIGQVCRTSIGDAAVALDGLALFYATAPEHRPDDEYHPG